MENQTELSFTAVIFDLDGVITKTAALHSKAWKIIFDDLLEDKAKQENHTFEPFSTGDYLEFVDGKPRYEGVSSFLNSRNIQLPWGNVDDNSSKNTICGIGNRKNKAFQEILENDHVEVYDSTLDIIRQLSHKGIQLAAASSSKNCMLILKKTDLIQYFKTVVDGVVSEQENLNGKPEPDIFIRACENLKVLPEKTIIVEDAVSGVQAGAKGGFGMTLGIARKNNSDELYNNGADYVVSDFREIKDINELNEVFLKFRQK